MGAAVHTSGRRRRAAAAVAVALLAGAGALAGTAGAQQPSSSGSTSTSSVSSASSASTASTVAPRTSSTTTTTGAAPPTSETEVTSPPDPPGTPFPAPLVAAVHPAVPDGRRPVQVEGFSVVPGAGEGEPQIAVAFADLFDLPAEPWRVSVVAGAPDGPRLRVSLLAEGGATTGRAEVSAGDRWTVVDTPEVTFDPSGLVLVPLDLSLVPASDGEAGPVVWVEAVLGEDGDAAQVATATPWFDLASVVGSGEPGLLVGGRLAPLGAPSGADDAGASSDAGATNDTSAPDVTADGDPVTVVDLGASPVLALAREATGGDAVRSAIVLRYDTGPPTEVAGQGVTEVVDLLRVAPDFVGGAVVTPYIELNRTTGAVRLVDARQWPLVDATGDGSWQRADASSGSVTGPATVAFDLDAVLAALGDVPDRSTVALGLTRTVRLADGSQVVAEGVLGSTAWLDTAVGVTLPTAALPAPAVPVAPPAATEGDDGVPPAGIAAVIVLLVAGLGLLESGRRKRAAARLDAELDAGTVAPGVPTGEQLAVVTDERREPAPIEPGASAQPRWGAAAAGVAVLDEGSATDDAAHPDGERAGEVEQTAEAPPGAPGSLGAPGPPGGDEPSGAGGPWWEGMAAAPERPRHRAEGVTIDADLVTDLVPVTEASPAAPPADERADLMTGAPPEAPAGPPPAAESATADPADPADRSEPVEPAEPAATDAAQGPNGSDDGASAGRPSPRRLLDADVDALAERLRRLGGDPPT